MLSCWFLALFFRSWELLIEVKSHSCCNSLSSAYQFNSTCAYQVWLVVFSHCRNLNDVSQIVRKLSVYVDVSCVEFVLLFSVYL